MGAKRVLRAAALGVACGLVGAGAVRAAPPAGATSCTGCHAQSTSVASPAPRIAGMDAETMLSAMQAFRAGTRPATVMDRIAKGFSDDEIRAIALWYAGRR